MSEREILSICSWCLPRTIRILGRPPILARGEMLRWKLDPDTGNPEFAWTLVGTRYREFEISHGICPEHAEKMRPEPVRVQ